VRQEGGDRMAEGADLRSAIAGGERRDRH
jgi:hypothetical protein